MKTRVAHNHMPRIPIMWPMPIFIGFIFSFILRNQLRHLSASKGCPICLYCCPYIATTVSSSTILHNTSANNNLAFWFCHCMDNVNGKTAKRHPRQLLCMRSLNTNDNIQHHFEHESPHAQSAAEDLVTDVSMMRNMTQLMQRPTSNVMLTAKHNLGCNQIARQCNFDKPFCDS